MDQTEYLDELLICRLDERARAFEPCTIVIFGASGDLTARKLIPALYHLYADKQLPSPFRIIGVARREKTSESWRQELLEDLRRYSRTKPPFEPSIWDAFAENVFYCQGDISVPGAYEALKRLLTSFNHESLRNHLLFYLAISPSQFAEVAEHLHKSELLRKQGNDRFWQRVII